MTDEQASFLAASIAFRGRADVDIAAAMTGEDAADSIATLARSLYMDLRDMTQRREQLDLSERLASLTSQLEAAR